MDLPLRILHARTAERVISVDGAWGQPGLNLSHWPGNATPAELRHDLSTGSALAFARLAPARRAELAQGCVAIANNHYDTDGACAVFAVSHPELALAREGFLLDVAATGDFFRFPSERALIVELIVENLVDAQRSPWSARFAGMSDRERTETALCELIPRFHAILDGDVEPYADLWKPELEDARADLAALAHATRDEISHLDLCIWTAPPAPGAGAPSARFDPGRHAVFGSTRADRVLLVGPQAGGATYRFLLSTLSWFDLVSRTMQPRPELAELARRLNELEGRGTPGDRPAEPAWHAQDVASPSPELWFGSEDHALFAERAPALAPSRLPPSAVRRAIAEALRASWVFPEE